ncbi:MAG: virulence factor TspB C-terminal domain-related protein [Neisseria subflava]
MEKNGKGKSGDGSESGNDKGNGKGSGQGDQDGRGKGEGSGSGSGEGKGNGSESGEATVAGADWGSLNGKQGGFKHQKANRFNEVGRCPMPIQFQFQVLNARGNFAFSYHVICDVALRLRPLLIAFAYIVSASVCFGVVVSKSD